MQSPQTVSFKTLGCRLNQAETDSLEAQFRARGFLVRAFGTPAATLAKPVSSTETRRRCRVLREIDRELRRRFARRFLGRKLPVLFETPKSVLQTGHTANFLTIRAPYEKNLRGEIRNVFLGELHDHQTISGKIAED